jgi:hypothetical protein
VYELGDLRQLPLGETEPPGTRRVVRRTELRDPRNDGRNDTVSEQMETRQVILARGEEPRQHLKVLVEKREAWFSEPRNLEFAAHHLEDPVDIKHQPDGIDSSYLIGIAPYRQASGNEACLADSPMPPQVRSIGAAV